MERCAATMAETEEAIEARDATKKVEVRILNDVILKCRVKEQV